MLHSVTWNTTSGDPLKVTLPPFAEKRAMIGGLA
jgi:hypothetical protein